LFGMDAASLAGPDGAFRCRYGSAIAGNLSAITRDVSAGWQAADGIARAMQQPDASDPSFRTTDDALQEIVGVFIHGFEAMRDLKLNPAIGETIEKTNPRAWIYQRSELTDASLHSNFSGLSELYDTSKIADLLPEPERWAKASIAFEFGNAGRTFQTIGLPLAIASADPDKRSGVGYLVILTQSLQDLFTAQLAPALGLSAGFSALDGD
ncbi:MAG: peptidase M75, Imelysin, partial [Rhizobiaceae bacterium]|nr:peptidase M75, Imelysin [Rhizobiaceae bacterium]